MLLSMGSSDKSGSNEDGSSVFDHYFVVSGLIKFKRKIGGRGKSYVQRKLVSDGGMRPAGESGYIAEVLYQSLVGGCAVATVPKYSHVSGRSVQCRSTTGIFRSNSCKDGRVKMAPT